MILMEYYVELISNFSWYKGYLYLKKNYFSNIHRWFNITNIIPQDSQAAGVVKYTDLTSADPKSMSVPDVTLNKLMMRHQ